jgi:ATP-binding cassette subfamily C protein CydC
LLADPALLILDEPTAHLDPDDRRALTRDLLAATAGRATLLITHDLDAFDQLDEIIMLREGKVTERRSRVGSEAGNRGRNLTAPVQANGPAFPQMS